MKPIALFCLFCVAAASCGSKDAAMREVKDGVLYTTIRTSEALLLLVEPAPAAERHFEPVVVYTKGKGETETECYKCWRRYYDCIFGGGSDCTTIGKKCPEVCDEERGKAVILAPTTIEALTQMLSD